MPLLMDENFYFQCFCTEKYEKCVHPDKHLSIKATPQGRENKKIRLLCRNQAKRAARQPQNQATETEQPGNQTTRHLSPVISSRGSPEARERVPVRWFLI